MRIAIFNVKYSPNLGDGIIAECLEHALAARPGVEARSVDLAGRQEYGTGLDGSRSHLLGLLQRLPRPARHLAVRVLLGGLLRVKLRPRWRRALEGCDAVIVGGGQLIADADLNFPLKLAAAAAESRRRRLPVAVFGVGAAAAWSPAGARLLRGLFAGDVAHCAVRDQRSQDALRALLGDPARAGGQPLLCRDPGLLAAQTYPQPARARPTPPLVGLGITHPAILHAHADASDALPPCDTDHYAALALALRRAGYAVCCFTNGAAEDEACLAALRARLDAVPRGGPSAITFAARPRRPADLARTVAGFDAVVGHRLHAHILAYAYGIPSVGLHWDGKLGAFLDSVGRGSFLAVPGRTPLERIVLLVTTALRVGIDAAERAAVIAEAEQGIARMAEDLRAACAVRGRARWAAVRTLPGAARSASTGYAGRP